MAVKTALTMQDIQVMLADYAIGRVNAFSPIADGTVQTNYLLETASGKYVLRYYENRSDEQVYFEMLLLQYLQEHQFPCAPMIGSGSGKPGLYRQRPYLIFQFVEGQQIEQPDLLQRRSLIYTIADLARLTLSLKLKYAEKRISYTRPYLYKLVSEITQRMPGENAANKKAWFLDELAKLDLPADLAMGICHCDYDYKNILYSGNEVKALLDFDDANYTYLFFDILSVIHFFKPEFNHKTWSQFNRDELILDFSEARTTLAIFEQKYPILQHDKNHIFDIVKLGILVDCLWYFDRGSAADFFERRKVEAINDLGRDRFFDQLFG